jgi:hypothetical protein
MMQTHIVERTFVRRLGASTVEKVGMSWCDLCDSRQAVAVISALRKGNRMVATARDLPASGYALEVDGRLKAEFATRDGAKMGAEQLKKRFPMLKIRIYDTPTKTREDAELS